MDTNVSYDNYFSLWAFYFVPFNFDTALKLITQKKR